jgi:hypothetical protein
LQTLEDFRKKKEEGEMPSEEEEGEWFTCSSESIIHLHSFLNETKKNNYTAKKHEWSKRFLNRLSRLVYGLGSCAGLGILREFTSQLSALGR